MRAKNKTLWTVALLLMTAAPAVAQDQIPWQYDLERAKQIAGQQNKLVLLHFWADNCPPCRALEANVFPNLQVSNAVSADFVPVKIHARRQPAIAKQYGVNRWPTDVIITPSGQIVAKSVSPANALQYVSFVKGAAGRGGVRSAATQLTANAQQRAGNFAAGAAAAAGGAFNPGANNGAPPQSGFNPQGAAVQNNHMAHAQGGFNPQGAFNPGNQNSFSPQGPAAGSTAAPQNKGFNPSAAAGGAFAGNQGSSAINQNNRNFDRRRAEQMARKNAPWPPKQVTAAEINGAPEFNPGASQRDAGYQPPAATPEMQENRFATQQPTGPATNQFASQKGAGVPAQQASLGAGASVDSTPLCLDGFCPVTLVESEKWVRANPKFGLIHRRRTYQFLNAEAQKKFYANPDRYAPILSGYDPVIFAETGQLVEGSRKHGAFYKNQVYLFSSEASLTQFDKASDRYAGVAHQAMLRNEIGRRMR